MKLGSIVWAAVIALAGATAGCEEEAGEVRSYVDSAGRSCSVDLSDISQTATCDVTPASAGVTCSDGTEPAFVLHEDYDFDTMIYSLESCGACIDRAARTSLIASMTCVSITCETDLDCPLSRYTCQSGTCR